jgi:hypothetical protein
MMHENGDAHLLMRLNVVPKMVCRNYANAVHKEDIDIINRRVCNNHGKTLQKENIELIKAYLYRQ